MIESIKSGAARLKSRIMSARAAEDEKRARARRNDNVPPQITDEDRRKAREEVARAKRERTTDSDIPAADREDLTKMIETEEVPKFAKGGLVRGSVRGGGVALRGLGKGKIY